MRILKAVLPVFLLALAGCTAVEEPPQKVPQPPQDVVRVAELASVPQASTEPTRLNAVSELVVAANEDLEIALGTGWGRLTVRASGPLLVRPELRHATMSDLSLFSDDGDGTYDDGVNHTLLSLYPSDSQPTSGDNWLFSWWGIPGWSIWPHDSAETWGFDGIQLKDNETATILAATTVPGYSLRFGSGSRVLQWELGVQPGHGVHLPDPSRTSTDVGPVHAAEETRWDVALPAQPPSILLQRSWEIQQGIGARAEVVSDDLGCSTTNPLVQLPGAEYDYGAGGTSYSASTGTTTTSETADLSCFRHRTAHGVNAMDVTFGAGFLLVPL